MKIFSSLLLTFLTFACSAVSAQENAHAPGHTINKEVSAKFAKISALKVLRVNDLVANILSVSADKKEQLQLLLLWASDNMYADSIRFFNGGFPLSVQQSIAGRKGLCDEFSAIVEAFCNAAKIQSIKVPGYVKYPALHKGEALSQTNHAWNVVFIDSWIVCDLFWSIVALDEKGHFVKRLDPAYFLAQAADFKDTHLPADPVFQLNDHPVTVAAFQKVGGKHDANEKTMPFLNYKDSLTALLKMSPDARALRMAFHAYAYNKDNPNELIKESFNAGVTIINSATMVKAELLNARKHFNVALSLIDSSSESDIKELKEQCIRGLSIVEKRLVNAR